VFKVKYDGREMPCDYTELVLSRVEGIVFGPSKMAASRNVDVIKK
jgi:hypothetical protein